MKWKREAMTWPGPPAPIEGWASRRFGIYRNEEEGGDWRIVDLETGEERGARADFRDAKAFAESLAVPIFAEGGS